MFYSYKQAKFSLNNYTLPVEDLQFSLNANVANLILSNDKHVNRYAATNGINGNLRLRYYLTGDDFIKDYLTTETPFSGYFGGLYFRTGFVQGYSFQGVPNQPVAIDVDVVFFDQLTGVFAPVFTPDVEKTFLNFSNVTVDGTAAGDNNSITRFNYSFLREINPVYYVVDTPNLSNVVPNDYSFGRQEVTAGFASNNLTGILPIEGLSASISLNLKNDNGITKESFSISGPITKKTFTARKNSIIESEFEITQNSSIGLELDEFLFTGFDPRSGPIGTVVTLSGQGFNENIIRVRFMDLNSLDVTFINSRVIEAVVPPRAIDGPITLTLGIGELYSDPDIFDVTDPGIIIELDLEHL